jgi:hypothetical protein
VPTLYSPEARAKATQVVKMNHISAAGTSSPAPILFRLGEAQALLKCT